MAEETIAKPAEEAGKPVKKSIRTYLGKILMPSGKFDFRLIEASDKEEAQNKLNDSLKTKHRFEGTILDTL